MLFRLLWTIDVSRIIKEIPFHGTHILGRIVDRPRKRERSMRKADLSGLSKLGSRSRNVRFLTSIVGYRIYRRGGTSIGRRSEFNVRVCRTTCEEDTYGNQIVLKKIDFDTQRFESDR